MSLTHEQQREIESHRPQVLADLGKLIEACLVESGKTRNTDSATYLTQGAARRLELLRRVVDNVFTLFPLGTTAELERGVLSDLAINLHAFQINAHGVFDNWAWSFLHHHGLVERVGSPVNVGMFRRKTAKFFPEPIQSHVKTMSDWSGDYSVPYRDALAHRIPAYLPPFVIRRSMVERYSALDAELESAKRNQDWDRCNELMDEQNQMGEPAYFFAADHSRDSKTKPAVLHAQVLADSNTVIELGKVFLAHWLSPFEDRADLPETIFGP